MADNIFFLYFAFSKPVCQLKKRLLLHFPHRAALDDGKLL